MKKWISLLLAAALVCALTACAAKPVTTEIFAMDTYMALAAYGRGAQDALADAARAINLLESDISRTRKGSSLYTLNQSGSWRGSAEGTDCTAELLELALQYSRETGGLFDATIAPLVELWDITGDAPYVPAQEEIDALLPLVGAEHLRVSGNSAALDAGCAVDLGGIGKGYASDLVADILAAHGVKSATVSLGGNVYVCGDRPDGKPWNVGIQDPQGDGCAAYVTLSEAFAVTSGGYQRFFTADDGTVYQHILDPRTGAPAESDLLSVTVILRNGAGREGTMADAYSTALYVMGAEGAVDFYRAKGNFDMILITADHRVLYTPLLIDHITLAEESPYELQLIH